MGKGTRLLLVLGALLTFMILASPAWADGNGKKCGHYPPDPSCPPTSHGNNPGEDEDPEDNNASATLPLTFTISNGDVFAVLGLGAVGLGVLRRRR